MRAVRYDRHGDVDVLEVREVPDPTPGPGEVLVRVRAAACNPGEAAIRTGAFGGDDDTFPSGQGSDLAGVVEVVGDTVTAFSVGEEVLGYSWNRDSQAELVAVPVGQLVRKPAGVPWEVAGSVYVVGVTAWAAVHAVDPQPGEVVAVSAAAGGVGTLVTQWLRHLGAEVVGIASEANHAWLRSVGATPLAYGDDLEEQLRALHPVAFVDLFGPEYVELADSLGIDHDRIETIISFEKAGQLGTKAEGSTDASRPEVLAEVTGLVADGTLTIPVAATFPLEQVQDAYRLLEQRHTHGKVVLLP